MAIVSLAAIAANLFAPILSFPFPQPDGSTVSTWMDLRNPSASSYEQSLLIIPIVAYASLAALAAVWMVVDRLPKQTALRLLPWERPLVWAAALLGFLLALTGTRWFGFYLSQLAPDGPALTHLHVVPYLNLALGLTILAGTIHRIVENRVHKTVLPPGPDRWTVLSAITAATGLLVMPLMPFARAVYPEATIPLEEFILAVMASQDTAWSLASPMALVWARVTIWTVLATSLTSLLASHLKQYGLLPRWLHGLRRIPRTHIVFVALGAFCTVAFYVGLPKIRPNVVFFFNPFLPLTLLLLGVFWWMHGRRMGRGASHVR